MKAVSIEVVQHAALSPGLIEDLRCLFDAEYYADFGEWDPQQPYGYASHDVHLIARVGADVVGHVGWARRSISVGATDVDIAGVGGMLIAANSRGRKLGERLMHAADQSMTETGGIQFGYLGCREEVVPFYRACGWQRITAGERSVSRDGQAVEDPPGQPLLILPVSSCLASWPSGSIDLRGRTW
ncbi:GNAT family N-acetyltransferase [Zhihengliuella halotolerans]|uniref:GNAT family N-acetyltransferase n=1 Tax=Zhihengliuella halotolerans TaxID=370736 RepID=UPI000C7FBDBF|nr:GNAT family N-acetyltransferase [Zhihengliuella halotolerans]